MECQSCGEEIEDGSQFCRFCGEELVAIPDEVDLKRELQSMDGYEFEHLVADLWEGMGWNCEVSTASNDKGIDVRARKTDPYEQKALIQAKRYGAGNKVGSPDIQQYSSLKHQEDGVDKVVMVTTSSYSRNAKDLADDLNVKLIDGDNLVNLIEQEDAKEIVTEYIDFEPDEEEESVVEVDDEPEPDRGWRDTPAADHGRTSETSYPRRRNISLPDTVWNKWVKICTVAWGLLFVLIDVLPEAIGGPVILALWIALPVCLYKDSQATREVVQWPKRRKAYLAVALFPVFGLFAGIAYLINRYRVQRRSLDVEPKPSAKTENSRVDHQADTAPSSSSSNLPTELGIENYTDATDYVKQFKRDRNHDAAEELLLWCIDQAEMEAREKGYSAPPRWYYKHLGIVYRRDDRYADERDILERYVDMCNELGGEPREEIVGRLERSRELAQQA
ncbi:restriction endonuclease [Haloterrigena sp. SYSU A558-1]|uniref:Restriction endonuclease n=1 Tax=Haloterrigena gelatinilytica TaxID=2741724 RepID=A0ABX2L669_9EURY|nr:restriction endonuclease [Haloterrigena gelatinilytica]NUC71722.1 restriction endonuclease [Haloterrigena gelatinilytica]